MAFHIHVLRYLHMHTGDKAQNIMCFTQFQCLAFRLRQTLKGILRHFRKHSFAFLRVTENCCHSHVGNYEA